MANIRPIIDHLARARARLLRAADSVPAEQWQIRYSADTWSAGEVVGHLITVEQIIVNESNRLCEKAPDPVPLLKRFHLPLALVESRLIRRKTPIPLDEKLLGQKEEMLAELRTVRGRSLAFLSETRSRELREYCWPHPFLGMLNIYEWFHMIASHEIRHTKQILEISSNLPKPIATRQK